jgi:hypothetical protein
MAELRDLRNDKRKPFSQLLAEEGMLCTIPDCGRPLTTMRGKGSSKYCIEHQLYGTSYGGAGVDGRPHTYQREWVCVCCGKDVQETLRKIRPNLEKDDPAKFNQISRGLVVGDHIIRKSDGGDDSKENIQSLCLDCDRIKTYESEDYLIGSIKAAQKSLNIDV